MVKSYKDAQRYVCERLKVDTIEQARALYLAKDRQARANMLYHLGVGGGVLGISPKDYPNCAPVLRRCTCGAYWTDTQTQYEGTQHDLVYRVVCKCGKRTKWHPSNWAANVAWDKGELDEGVEQLSLF